jgi:inhibitor of KinA
MNSVLRIATIGDSTLLVELGNGAEADTSVNARAVALASRVQAAAIRGVVDVVPTFQTVGVYFDPLKTDVGALSAWLRRTTEELPATRALRGALHLVPVCYGGKFGPDLRAVAASAGLSEDEVVTLHAKTPYRVFMMGFTPGFAYLGPLNPAIALPRRVVQRTNVAPGSVAIAGRQTAIYPSASPGGWHIIGRTALRPFDAARAVPFLFRPGDNVQFYPIPAAAHRAG